MEIKTDTGIHIGTLDQDLVDRINRIEMDEGTKAIVEFSIINGNIWMLNIRYQTDNGKSVIFESLNLMQEGTEELVYNMQDGKMYGFEIEKPWFGNVVPRDPVQFIDLLLTQLFEGY
jgi:hypothetical protein